MIKNNHMLPINKKEYEYRPAINFEHHSLYQYDREINNEKVCNKMSDIFLELGIIGIKGYDSKNSDGFILNSHMTYTKNMYINTIVGNFIFSINSALGMLINNSIPIMIKNKDHRVKVTKYFNIIDTELNLCDQLQYDLVNKISTCLGSNVVYGTSINNIQIYLAGIVNRYSQNLYSRCINAISFGISSVTYSNEEIKYAIDKFDKIFARVYLFIANEYQTLWNNLCNVCVMNKDFMAQYKNIEEQTF